MYTIGTAFSNGPNAQALKERTRGGVTRYYPVICPDRKTVMTEGLKLKTVLNIQQNK